MSFSFQVGLVRDKITVDSTDLLLKSIKTPAYTFITNKFPEHQITRLEERFIVFRYNYTAENILQMINTVTEV